MNNIIAFAHIPKTAGTTLVSILRRSYGTRHFDRPGFYRPLTAEDLTQIRKIYRNLASLAGHTIQPHSDLHTQHPIRYYTFFRDPEKRLISEFKFHVRRSAYDGKVHNNLIKTWNTWLPNRRNYQCKYISNEESAEKTIEVIQDRISFIGLLERFDESLILLKKWANDPRLNIHYKTLNKGDGGSEHGRVTQTLIQEIDLFCKQLANDPSLNAQLTEAVSEDQKLYDYICSVLYPKQCSEYGQTLAQDTDQFKKENQQIETKATETTGSKLFRDLIWKPARPFLLPE